MVIHCRQKRRAISTPVISSHSSRHVSPDRYRKHGQQAYGSQKSFCQGRLGSDDPENYNGTLGSYIWRPATGSPDSSSTRHSMVSRGPPLPLPPRSDYANPKDPTYLDLTNPNLDAISTAFSCVSRNQAAVNRTESQETSLGFDPHVSVLYSKEDDSSNDDAGYMRDVDVAAAQKKVLSKSFKKVNKSPPLPEQGVQPSKSLPRIMPMGGSK